MSTPILADLRIRFKEAEITAFCLDPLSTLLEKDPHLNSVIGFKKPNSSQKHEETKQIVQTLRRGQYDVGLLLTNSFSSAWWFWRGHVKKRIGFATNLRSLFLTKAVPFPKERSSQHLVLTYKALLNPLGIRSSSLPKLYITEEEISKAKKILQNYPVSFSKCVGMNTGAAYGSAKCWPSDYFKSLAKKLLEDEDLCVIFFGDVSMQATHKEICSDLGPRAINLAGQTSLRDYLALLSQCDLFITNDSGPMHMAAALEIPTIALFGSTNPAITGPYTDKAKVFYKKVECSPCYLRTCPIDKRCMTKITVDEVYKEARKVLS